MKIFKTKRLYVCKSCGHLENVEIHDKLDFDCPSCEHPLMRNGKQLIDCLIYSTNPEYKEMIDDTIIEIKRKINPPDLKKIHEDDVVYFASCPKQYEAWRDKLKEYNSDHHTGFKSIYRWIRNLREKQCLILKDAAAYTPVSFGLLSKMISIYKIKKPPYKSRSLLKKDKTVA